MTEKKTNVPAPDPAREDRYTWKDDGDLEVKEVGKGEKLDLDAWAAKFKKPEKK